MSDIEVETAKLASNNSIENAHEASAVVESNIAEETPVEEILPATVSDEEQQPEVHAAPEVTKDIEEEQDDEGMDDLFGDDDDEDEDDDEGIVGKRAREMGEDVKEDEMSDEDDNAGSQGKHHYRTKDQEDDEEEEEEEEDYEIKEADVTLSRHVIPYKTLDNNTEDDANIIYHVKVPQFLKIDSKPFDPQVFEEEVESRLNDPSYQREDKIDAGLIEENTIRWRYSKDENNNVSKESNAVIVQWDDGSYSLKLGDEYTDIIVNDIDNSLLVKSYEQEELMQSAQGGFMNKSMMFTPTSMNSNIHKKLTKAVHNHNFKEQQNIGPKTFIIKTDPDVELKALEKKQDQILRERRRIQLKEQLERENALYGDQDRAQSPFSFNKRATSQYDDEETNHLLGHDGDDDDEEEEEEEEEEEYDNFINDDEVEGEGEESEEEEGAGDLGAERLRNVKKHGFGFNEEEDDDDENTNSVTTKRRKVVVEEDDED